MEPEKTWTKDQAHFIEAQADLREQQETSHQGGCSIAGIENNAMEISMDFANLAQAMSEDHATINNLMTENSTLTNKVALYSNRLPTK